MRASGRWDFDALSESIPNELRPPLDRENVDENALGGDQRAWRRDGYLIKRGFIPDALTDAYARRRQADGEYRSPTPYMQIAEIRALCLYAPLMELLGGLIGEPMALHLNLTGWVSTERGWHQDDYLNPPCVRCHYAAVWFALDEIDPLSGPFEYVPGTHRWPVIRRDKLLAALPPEEAGSPQWPKSSERIVVPAIEERMKAEGLEAKEFIPASKGDILVWHAALVHRGSSPKVIGTPRRAIISHYSAISKREDMPETHPDGYFIL